MGRYIIARLIQSIPVLILVSVISFSVMQLVPGDPAILIGGPTATPEELANIRANLGLDQPFHLQMLRFYTNLAQGDLGTSLLLGKPVLWATIERIPVSLSIAIYSMVLTLFFGLAFGVIAALWRNSWLDQSAMLLALLGVSMPNFWLGLMLIILFSVTLGLLPAGGYVPLADGFGPWFISLLLPSLSLGLLQMGLLARITRSTMLEILRQDYIRTAHAKGLTSVKVVGKHALKNAMIPIVTVIGIIFSQLLSGSVVVETVYSLPGLGRMLATSILSRDYPVIQGGLLLTAAMFVGINLIVDVFYAFLDPRVRYD